MSDILDYIRSALADQPHIQQAVDPVLVEARRVYAGDESYIRRTGGMPRDISGGSMEIARRYHVSRRTAQRWKAREKG